MSRTALVAPWVWLVGTPLTLMLVSCGFAGTHHLRRHSQALSEPWGTAMVDRLRRALNLGQEVAVAVSAKVTRPILIGVIRPLILLPPALLSGCTPEQIEMVLLHELAHVKRWDLWVNLFQQITVCLLFFSRMVEAWTHLLRVTERQWKQIEPKHTSTLNLIGVKGEEMRGAYSYGGGVRIGSWGTSRFRYNDFTIINTGSDASPT